MPPEPSSWDRKDIFRDRKNERPEASFGSGSRWRDSCSTSPSSHHASVPRDFSRLGSAEYRRLPGQGKQGGWHLFHEEGSHGYVPFRSGDRLIQDSNCRANISRGEWRYNRSSRDNRGSSSQRDGKPQLLEGISGTIQGTIRPCSANNDQRSVVSKPVLSSSTHDLVRVDQLCLNDRNDDKVTNIDGLNLAQQCEKEGAVETTIWKSMKWLRSGNLTSRGSGFSHSSSSKSLGQVDSDDMKVEVLPKDAVLRSSLVDATVCPPSTVPLEEMSARKKPRLGWGEGLAKYERKKGDGSDVNTNKDGNTGSSNSAEPVHSLSPNIADRSPRVICMTDCASPATPSSVACSSSQGVDEKSVVAGRNDNYASNICSSSGIGSQPPVEGFPFNLEELDNSLIDKIGCFLNELFQCVEPGSMDSSFGRSCALSKVLVWKGDVFKSLETTETEIECLENELKVLKADSEADKTPKYQDANTSWVPQPSPHKNDSIASDLLGKKPFHQQSFDGDHADLDEDVESPGTATSKFSEALMLVNTNPSVDMEINVERSRDMDGNLSSGICVSNGNEDTLLIPKVHDFDAEHLDTICAEIVLSNKESAKGAAEVFNKLLPNEVCCNNISRISDASCPMEDSAVRREVTRRCRSLKLKERVLALKFRALHYLWKEDLHEMSIRKSRTKPQKRHELSLRIKNGGCQKQKSLIRSQYFHPGDANTRLSQEFLCFIRGLISNPKTEVYRNELKMPALVLDEKEKTVGRFISVNGLVEDPWAVEKERVMINPWTSEEKRIFMDKLAIYGKNFRKIASFLDQKTTADCVEFYYKNHKSDYFDKPKKIPDGAKQQKRLGSTYMVTPAKKWNREVNAASLDILGSVSVMAARADVVKADKHMPIGQKSLGDCSSSRSLQHDDVLMERSSRFDLPEKETLAADVLAGICGSMSSEAISSCITASFDPKDKSRNGRWRKTKISVTRPSISDGRQNPDDSDTSPSDESCAEMDPSNQWTDEERAAFMQAVLSFGKDFQMLSRFVRTKSADQCRVFYSKARKRLGLQSLHPLSGNSGTLSDDSNVGGGDMEDGCALRTSSSICNDQKPDTKVDLNWQGSSVDAGEDISDTLQRIKMSKLDGNTTFDSDLKEGAKITDSSICLTMSKPAVVSINVSEEKMLCANGMENLDDTTIPVAVDEIPCHISFTPTLSSYTAQMVGEALVGKDRLSHGTSLSTIDKRAAERDTTNGNGESVSDIDHADLHHVPIQLDYTENPLLMALPRGKTAKSESNTSPFSQTTAFHCKEQSEMCKIGDQASTLSNIQYESWHCLVNSLVNLKESGQIPPPEKEVNEEIYNEGTYNEGRLTVKSTKPETSNSNLRLAHAFSLRGCRNVTCKARTKHPPCQEQKSGPKTQSCSLSDSEKPNSNHNVRLFGKVLTAHEHEDKFNHKSMSDSQATKKFSGEYYSKGVDIDKVDDASLHCLENVPVTSYAFWDEDRIKKKLQVLADPATFLAKYPAAFSNIPRVEQPEIFKKNGRSNSPSSPKESKGIVELCRDRNGVSKVPLITEAISSLPLGRDVAANILGTGVEVPISDPVTAIKMHYARAGQFSSKKGSLIREESLGSKRDIAR